MKRLSIPFLLAVAALLALAVPALAQQLAPAAAARLSGLFETANNAFRDRAFDHARAGYARILADPDVTLGQRLDALNRTAATWQQERLFDRARAEYARILALTNLNVNQRIEALNRTADTWNAEGKGGQARKVCEVTLQIPDFPEPQRRSVLERLAGSYVAEGDTARLTETLASMNPLYSAWNWAYTDLHHQLEQLAAKRLTARDFPAALAGYVYLTGSTNLDPRRRFSAVKGLVKARAGLKEATLRDRAVRVVEQALRDLADHPKTSPQDRLLYRIQLAALPGLGGDFKNMGKDFDQALKMAGGLSCPEQLAIVRNANLLFMAAREYEVAKALKSRADALIESSRAPNVYTCRFLPEVPKGVGAWAQSDFVKDAGNAHTRFFAYPGGEEDKLIADMGALRPLAEQNPEAVKGRAVALYMAYDTYGWHLFIRSDEPEIEQIRLEDGRRGSTLEFYFAPGLKGEVYYQWLVDLTQGKVDLYHWNTPHRFYRYLENKVGSLQIETAVLKTGWGTSISIAWEALYDKLPFLEGNEDTWRFSAMRWGPINLTWGGTVHESGRWGMVKWHPPTPAQLLEIQRHLVRKAWWRYQARQGQLSDFWQSPRGDQVFYDKVLAPFFARQNPFAEQMKQVTQWEAKTVSGVFAEQVPLWMELHYLVEEWRADFLTRDLFAE